VLDYLTARQRLAEIQNDRSARLHYEQCWVQAFLAYYGPNLLPPAYRCPKIAPAVQPPLEVPPWKREMLARPLRRVTGRREVVMARGEQESPLLGVVEVLECGHELAAGVQLEGAAPAKHRRCPECAERGAGLALVRKAARGAAEV
jgi:hypothetical protein